MQIYFGLYMQLDGWGHTIIFFMLKALGGAEAWCIRGSKHASERSDHLLYKMKALWIETA